VYDVRAGAVEQPAQPHRLARRVRAGGPVGLPGDPPDPPDREVVGESPAVGTGDDNVPAACLLVRAQGGHVGRHAGFGRLGHMQNGRHVLTRATVSSRRSNLGLGLPGRPVAAGQRRYRSSHSSAMLVKAASSRTVCACR